MAPAAQISTGIRTIRGVRLEIDYGMLKFRLIMLLRSLKRLVQV
jgi:hypothetical protein